MVQKKTSNTTGRKSASAERRKAAVAAISGGRSVKKSTKAKSDSLETLISQSTKVVEDAISKNAKSTKKPKAPAAKSRKKTSVKSVKIAKKSTGGAKQPSGKAVADGDAAADVLQEMNQQLLKTVNNTITRQFSMVESVLSCKTVDDFFNVSSALVNEQMSDGLDCSLKLSELSLKLNDAVAPFQQNFIKATK